MLSSIHNNRPVVVSMSVGQGDPCSCESIVAWIRGSSKTACITTLLATSGLASLTVSAVNNDPTLLKVGLLLITGALVLSILSKACAASGKGNEPLPKRELRSVVIENSDNLSTLGYCYTPQDWRELQQKHPTNLRRRLEDEAIRLNKLFIKKYGQQWMWTKNPTQNRSQSSLTSSFNGL